MFAGSIVSRGKIELIEIEEQAPPPLQPGKPGDILFQPEHACLCGSDMPHFCGDQDSYPLETGLSLHEMVGTVLETTGSRYKKGDRVLAVPERQTGFFQRYWVSESRAIPLDPRKPPEVAMLAQPLGTAIFALKKLPQVLDQDVAIVGQGPMGQIFCAALRNLGARRVIALDRLASRLAMSPRMGATHVIDVSKQDPAEEVARITGGTMADIVVEAVGHAEQQLDLCTDLCRQAGRILFFGVPQEIIHEISWLKLFHKNITIHTSVNPDFERDFPLAMQWVSEGQVDLAPLLTHSLPVEKIQEAFETFRDRVDGAIKVHLKFPD